MDRVSYFARTLFPLVAYAVVNTACGAGVPSLTDASADSSRQVDAAGVPNQHRYPPPACPGSTDDAPIPDGVGGHVCTYVGANRGVATGAWPDLATEIGPFVYVRTGATNGDGSASRPFGTIAQAAASTLPKRTIVLGPGRYDAVSMPTFSGAITLVGTGAGGAASSGRGGGGGGGGDAGADAMPTDDASSADAAASDAGMIEPTGTTIVVPRDAIGLTIDGSAANVTLRRLEISSDDSAMSIGVQVSNAALLTIEHVTISHVGTGILVRGSSLRASGLTVVETGNDAVSLQSGSNAVLNSVHLRTGRGHGILADASTLSISEGHVVDFARGGAILRGASPSGMDRIDRVVVANNTLVGIGAINATAMPPSRERTVDFSLVSVSGTRSVSATAGGYGVYLGDGITGRFDVSIDRDARRGYGSELLANARAGLVVSGASARLDLHGARLSSNGGPGLMLQNGAIGGRVGYSEFNDNDGAGALITSGATLAYFECNESSQNHLAPIAFTERSATIGDGLLVATSNAPQANLTMVANVFQDNERFGAFFEIGFVTVGLGNVSERNGARNGRGSMTVARGEANFIPEGFNTPSGTDLPLQADVLSEPAL